jgi:hypothetical protein
MHQGKRDDQGRRESDSRGSRVHLEPFGEKKSRDHVDRNQDGQNQTDDIGDHSFSTPRWIRPSSAKIATVTTANTTTDIFYNLHWRPFMSATG